MSTAQPSRNQEISPQRHEDSHRQERGGSSCLGVFAVETGCVRSQEGVEKSLPGCRPEAVATFFLTISEAAESGETDLANDQ